MTRGWVPIERCSTPDETGGQARRLRYTRDAMDTASRYAEDMTLREARALYFRDNEFGDDGGYHKKWVKVMLGPVPVYIYNTKMRVDAVRYHDLHHVVTGYATDLRGEAQIGAWEVAAGCGTKLAAWFLNLGAMVAGVVVDRHATFEAFVRGRHSRTLYDQAFSEELLDETVGAMRSRLRLDQPVPEPTTADRVAYLAWLVIGAVANLMPLAALVAVIWALVAWVF